MKTTLSWLEMFNACMVGVARRLSSISKGMDANKHAEVSNFQTDVEGAVAEACFAKKFSVYWSCSINSFKAPDVSDWQVRSTPYRHGHLIIRPNDKRPLERFAFGIVDVETFSTDFVGWIEAREAQIEKYWKVDAWWVPQSDLHPFGDTLQETASLTDWKPNTEGALVLCESNEGDDWRRYWTANRMREPLRLHGGNYYRVPTVKPPGEAA